jgi:hypothetical protein
LPRLERWKVYEDEQIFNRQILFYLLLLLAVIAFIFVYTMIGLVINGDQGGPAGKGYKMA